VRFCPEIGPDGAGSAANFKIIADAARRSMSDEDLIGFIRTQAKGDVR